MFYSKQRDFVVFNFQTSDFVNFMKSEILYSCLLEDNPKLKRSVVPMNYKNNFGVNST